EEEAAEGFSGAAFDLESGSGAALGSRSAAPRATALAAQVTAPPVGVVSGYVVDSLDANTGEGVSVRNASMVNGAPSPANLNAGDGRAPVPLLSGATTTVGYLDPGEFVVSMTAPSAVTTSAATAITVGGPTLPPQVAYTGVTTAVVGLPASVRADVTTAGGAPLGGRAVRFTLNGSSVETNSNAAGVAQVALVVPGPAGVTSLLVEVLPTDSGAGVSTSVPFSVGANVAPVADAGGPYQLVLNADLTLAGSGTDPDPGEQASLVYAWDLDGDTLYDDATGATPTIPWETARTVICGGDCTPGVAFPISLRVTDAKGAIDTDSADGAVARDFAIAILPSIGALVPNSATSFTVYALTDSDWNFPIVLSAPGLPTGVTAGFSPSTISAGQTSLLTLRAGGSIAPGDFGVTVQGTSNGVVRQAGGSLTLDFGLIPVCFGDISGRVLDEETGLPLAGAFVNLFTGGSTTTGADGTWHLANVPVNNDNGPRSYPVIVSKPGYRVPFPFPQALAACGTATVTPDISILRQLFGAVSGVLIGHTRDGATLGPINGPAQNGFVSYQSNVRVNADGTFQMNNIPLDIDNGPVEISLNGTAPGFWNAPSNKVTVTAGTVTPGVVADIEQRCNASVRARVVVAATGLPLQGARVSAFLGLTGTTDVNGYVTVTAPMPRAAQGNGIQMHAQTPASLPFAQKTVNTGVAGCGALGVVTIPLDVHIPVPNFGTIDVTVIDKETGLPIEGADVSPTGMKTDAQGKVHWQAFVGNDSDTVENIFLIGVKTGYWNSPAQQRLLHKDETLAVTLELVKPKYVSVEGTIRDRITNAPIGGVRVAPGLGPEAVFTAPDGTYHIDGLVLGPQNVARQHNVTISKLGYWGVTNQFTVLPTEPVHTSDASIAQVCRGATVRGRVLNAATGAPLENATVSSFNIHDQTDADGRFVLDPIPPGNNNVPWSVTVTAQKFGFITANKQITLFCGADVIVDFGESASTSGVIAGRVTNEDGDAIPNAFVGSQFGGSDTTDANGDYSIANVPLGPNDSDRTWNVTVDPPVGSGYAKTTKSVMAVANTTVDLDFVLGEANFPPVANDVDVSTDKGVAAPVTLAGFDTEGEDLDYEIVDRPGHGVLSGVAPDLTYTADPNFSGVDEFTFKVNDGTQDSNTATVTITIISDDLAPEAVIEVPEDIVEGDEVEIDGTSSTDSDGTIETYEWDLDEDGDFDDATGETVTMTRTDDDSVDVGLRVTDDNG
ncbi:MAG: PKD domain-containing protein, partial [Actinomycetota bacterium]|nr:PKD domain-containing protein [Actinomycetota bacterium]